MTDADQSRVRIALEHYARAMRETLRQQPPNPELACAPHFQALLTGLLPIVTATPPTVVGEWSHAGVGRPDIALARP
ncbi:MAG: hypothetical protein ACK40H_05180 [Sphingomonadaceae bacterium]